MHNTVGDCGDQWCQFIFLAAIAYFCRSVTPNLALQRTPHRRGAFSAIMTFLGGAGPLSFVVRGGGGVL